MELVVDAFIEATVVLGAPVIPLPPAAPATAASTGNLAAPTVASDTSGLFVPVSPTGGAGAAMQTVLPPIVTSTDATWCDMELVLSSDPLTTPSTVSLVLTADTQSIDRAAIDASQTDTFALASDMWRLEAIDQSLIDLALWGGV